MIFRTLWGFGLGQKAGGALHVGVGGTLQVGVGGRHYRSTYSCLDGAIKLIRSDPKTVTPAKAGVQA